MSDQDEFGDFDSDDPYERWVAHQRAKGNLPPAVAGRVLTDADIEALADEAERGYDVDSLRPRNSQDG